MRFLQQDCDRWDSASDGCVRKGFRVRCKRMAIEIDRSGCDDGETGVYSIQGRTKQSKGMGKHDKQEGH